MNEINNINQLKETLRLLVKHLGILDKKEGCCCGLTCTQFYAILEIGKMSKITLKDLSTNLNLDKSTVSRTVDSLVKMELVNIETLPENRKYVSITLSIKGKDLFNKIENGAEQYYKKILAFIPEDKRTQVIESINLLLLSVKEHKCCSN